MWVIPLISGFGSTSNIHMRLNNTTFANAANKAKIILLSRPNLYTELCNTVQKEMGKIQKGKYIFFNIQGALSLFLSCPVNMFLF